MLKKWLIITIVVLGAICCHTPEKEGSSTPDMMLTVDSIRIRDPFILPIPESKKYLMYAQMQNRANQKNQGVEVYESEDLVNWIPPKAVLTLGEDFPARKMVWAPEVHLYNGQYYLFVTLTSENKLQSSVHPTTKRDQWQRGTYIFVSDSPYGPFKGIKDGAHTPSEWMSLDGTLYVESGKPYMIFCHEWAQIVDGSMDIVPLKNDLSGAIGSPIRLFLASEASWSRNMQAVGLKNNGWVTDGPFFYRSDKGSLIMIWSSFGEQQYAIGQAFSESGSVLGPWKQINEPLVKANGGHGMIFNTFEGGLMMAFHQPNTRGKERLKLFPLAENSEGLLTIMTN